MVDQSAKDFSAAVRDFKSASDENFRINKTFAQDIAQFDLGTKTLDKVARFMQAEQVVQAFRATKEFLTKRKIARQEMKQLREALGISKKEFELMAAQKKTNDAFEASQQKLNDAATNLLGFSGDFVDILSKKGDENTKGLINAITKQRDALIETGEKNNMTLKAQEATARNALRLQEKAEGTMAARQEEEMKAAAAEENRQSIFREIADGVRDLNATFMKKIKEKGKAGLGLVAALIAAPIVALLSFFKELSLQLKLIGIIGDGGLLGKMFAPIGRFFTSFKNFFNMKYPYNDVAGFIDDVIKGAGRVLRPVGNFFSKLAGFFRTFVNYVKGLVAASASATGILKFAAGFGKVLGKFFLPVTIIMSAFDFITGFIDGFKESEGNNIVSRFIDGVGGALSKVIGNLIGIPLDLLKSGVSFIAGMLGFEEAEKFLDSFSFADLIMSIVKAPMDLMSFVVDYIVGMFTGENDLVGDIVGGLGNLMDTAKQFIKDMLRKILPNPKGNLLSKLASKAIPDSVYEFAGIDPDTGQIIPDPPEPPATAEPDTEGARKDLEKELSGKKQDKATAAPGERRQQQVEAAKERTRMRDAQDELNAGGKGQVAVNAPNVNAPTTTNSSSTTVTSTAMKPKEPTTQAAIQSAYM